MLLIIALTSNVAMAKANDYEVQAQNLNDLGLLQGNEKGFELDRAPSRIEAGVMLIRLLGKEEEALDKKYPHPFNDVPKWGQHYVGYLYEKGLAQGIGNGAFGSTDLIDDKSYMTFVLRALGYDDSKGDFTWSKAIEKGKEVGVVDTTYTSSLGKGKFLRGHMVSFSHQALDVKVKGQSKKLKDKLTEEGAIKAELIEEEKKETVTQKTKITLSNYRVESWGISDLKIHRETLPEEMKEFVYASVSGVSNNTPIDDDYIHYWIGKPESKQRLSYLQPYDDKNHSITIYSTTVIQLYNKNKELLGYGSWGGNVKEGTVELELKDLGEFVFNLEEIKTGVIVSKEGVLSIDVNKLPAKSKQYEKIVISPYSRGDSLPAIKAEGLEGIKSEWWVFEGNQVDLTNLRENWEKTFRVFFYDGKDNILGYTNLSAEPVINAIKSSVDLSGIHIVEKGVIPIQGPSDNVLYVYIHRQQLPKEVQDFTGLSTIAKSKDNDTAIVLKSYIYRADFKHKFGRPYNSSGVGVADTDFSSKNHYVLFFDDNDKLIGYHLIKEEEAKANRAYVGSIRIEFENEYEGMPYATDFNIRKYINGKEDLEFNKTGGSSSSILNNNKAISVDITYMFFEEGITYEVTSNNPNIKIKNVTLIPPSNN